MMKLIWLFPLIVSISACSTVPRAYTPVIAGQDLAEPEFAAILERCVSLVNAGVRSDFRGNWLTSSVVGVGSGYAAGSLVVASVGGGLAEATIAVSAASVIIPVAGIAGAVIYSRHVRARREREIQEATGLCLRENGYPVERWERERLG